MFMFFSIELKVTKQRTVEFLRQLPGVTDSNYTVILDGCQNLVELTLLPVEKLAELMGGQKVARLSRCYFFA